MHWTAQNKVVHPFQQESVVAMAMAVLVCSNGEWRSLKYIKTDVITIPHIIVLSKQIMTHNEPTCLRISFHEPEAVYILILGAALESSFLSWGDLTDFYLLECLCISAFKSFCCMTVHRDFASYRCAISIIAPANHNSHYNQTLLSLSLCIPLYIPFSVMRL